jgi:hypothetical protein
MNSSYLYYITYLKQAFISYYMLEMLILVNIANRVLINAITKGTISFKTLIRVRKCYI